MQENFLHYIWQYQKLKTIHLKTVLGNALQILKPGSHNQTAGPDFFNAQLLINNQKWAGNVEIHVKSSDWYVHRHQEDKNYDNIILHVVWEDDIEVFDKSDNPIETLVLKNLVDDTLLRNYKKLLQNKNWIPCEKDIERVDDFIWAHWKEKLIISRLQRKTVALSEILERTNQNWEALLFMLLAKNFGLKINQEQFLTVAQNISFVVFKKEISRVLSLEALLLGQANLLDKNVEDAYYQQLQQEYQYLKQKYQLQDNVLKMEFFGLRPASFPTLRLSQLASLYHQNRLLFSKVIQLKTLADAQQLFSVTASEYWDTHYTFGKTSSKQKKKLTKAFIALLLINVIIPIQYLYAKSLGKHEIESVLGLYNSISPEKNGIIYAFKKHNILVHSAFDSQALLELKNEYCDKRKCLQCQIGHQLLYSEQK